MFIGGKIIYFYDNHVPWLPEAKSPWIVDDLIDDFCLHEPQLRSYEKRCD